MSHVPCQLENFAPATTAPPPCPTVRRPTYFLLRQHLHFSRSSNTTPALGFTGWSLAYECHTPSGITHRAQDVDFQGHLPSSLLKRKVNASWGHYPRNSTHGQSHNYPLYNITVPTYTGRCLFQARVNHLLIHVSGAKVSQVDTHPTEIPATCYTLQHTGL